MDICIQTVTLHPDGGYWIFGSVGGLILDARVPKSKLDDERSDETRQLILARALLAQCSKHLAHAAGVVVV